MKKLISILLTLAMAVGLCACGGPKYDESLMGVYTCYAVEMLGVEMKADEVLSQTSTLELKQGGKGKMNIEGTTGSIKYTLDGENITVDIDGETATGTLKDSILHIEIMSMDMYFIQEGKEVPEVVAPEVGYFTFESMEMDGETLTKDDLRAVGGDPDSFFLIINEDGTGTLAIAGEDAQQLTWKDGTLAMGGETVPYTVDGDTLTLEEDGTKMIFTRSSDTPPAIPDGTASAEPEDSEILGEPEGSEEIEILDGDGEIAEPPVAVSTEPVSADLGDYHVTILAAEQFIDSSDKDAIRFYVDFTNNSEEEESFFFACNTEAYQDGYELVSTYAPYGEYAPEDGNYSRDILPGRTIRCIEEYNFKPDGGAIEFTVTEGYDGDSITMTFDPSALPGRPADEYTIEPCSSDELVAGLAAEGVYKDDYYVSITGCEVVEGWAGDGPVLRVFFDFTNNSQEATSFWRESSIEAMQDGIQLSYGSANDTTETDENESVEIQPGETISVSSCFTLHDTGSPVAVRLYNSFSGDDLGATFDVQ
ncbi:MAG: DUF5067 domain-containing protein [Oscillospiraceae bacterium]|nr:DUF5067 domain-containing protein [Oscillospiraceae bacterium]